MAGHERVCGKTLPVINTLKYQVERSNGDLNSQRQFHTSSTLQLDISLRKYLFMSHINDQTSTFVCCHTDITLLAVGLLSLFLGNSRKQTKRVSLWWMYYFMQDRTNDTITTVDYYINITRFQNVKPHNFYVLSTGKWCSKVSMTTSNERI